MPGLANYLLGVLVVIGLVASALVGALLAGLFCMAIWLATVISLVKIARWMDMHGRQ